jgi:hypothetical protein
MRSSTQMRCFLKWNISAAQEISLPASSESRCYSSIVAFCIGGSDSDYWPVRDKKLVEGEGKEEPGGGGPVAPVFDGLRHHYSSTAGIERLTGHQSPSITTSNDTDMQQETVSNHGPALITPRLPVTFSTYSHRNCTHTKTVGPGPVALSLAST